MKPHGFGDDAEPMFFLDKYPDNANASMGYAAGGSYY